MEVRVLTKKIAYELIKRNHDLINMEDNYKFPQYKVFVFKRTPELLSDLEILKNKK